MAQDPRGDRRVIAGPRLVESEITSTKSERVSAVRRLHERKHRQAGGAFVVEGPTNVAAAIESARATVIYATPSFTEAHPNLLAGIDGSGDGVTEIVTVTAAVMDAMSDTRQSQGILAVCAHVTRPPESLISDAAPAGTWVVLDRANDPGNAGTIIRTAEACGAGAVILTEGSVDPHNGKCVRASAGALFRIPIVTGASWDHVRAAAQGRRIIATAADGEVALGSPAAHEILRDQVIWLFGTEAHGLPDEILASADARMRIPMPGRAESLNVASAAAICLWESCRSAAPDTA